MAYLTNEQCEEIKKAVQDEFDMLASAYEEYYGILYCLDHYDSEDMECTVFTFSMEPDFGEDAYRHVCSRFNDAIEDLGYEPYWEVEGDRECDDLVAEAIFDIE